MFNKILKYFLISLIFYQTPLYSKSISFDDFNSKDLSVYFQESLPLRIEIIQRLLNFSILQKIY